MSPSDPDRRDPLSPPDHLSLPEPEAVASSGGVTVATYDLGGVGRDVVMVHATGFCGGVWLPLVRSLGGVRVVVLDVRGHGRSTVPADGMDWHGTADDVLAVVERFGLVDPVGVGHSMGGASLVLAEQACPGTFAGIWAFEPIIFPPELLASAGDGANPLAEGARRRRAEFPSAAAAIENYSAKPPLAALAPAALAAYVAYGFEERPDGSVHLRCPPEVEAATYEMGGRHDGFVRLGEVRCPTVVARGTAAFGGPAMFAPAVAAALAHGELEEHPALGHFGPLEDPVAMAASVRALVDRVGGPAAGAD